MRFSNYTKHLQKLLKILNKFKFSDKNVSDLNNLPHYALAPNFFFNEKVFDIENYPTLCKQHS